MKAVILAGGKGTRLLPYTTVFPKPLMPVGDMPILEIVCRQLTSCGFDEIIMCVGHLSELIKAFFGDGTSLGTHITYSREDTPLGTVGGLGLLKEQLNETFLVMNGDTLTTLDYAELVRCHNNTDSIATIALNERHVNIDFGVIELESDCRIKEYNEKPSVGYLVSMGVYIFDPSVLSYIQPGQYLDFPDLVKTMIRNEKQVRGYIYDGYWLDIGRPDDYAKANSDRDGLWDQLHLS